MPYLITTFLIFSLRPKFDIEKLFLCGIKKLFLKTKTANKDNHFAHNHVHSI